MSFPRRILKRMQDYPAFYQAVWKICASIPKGEMRTYGWIARRLGKPRAARAVGQALAKNPFAPLVPCHRVIGSDGRLTGFSGPGGLQAKRRLLEREGALPAGTKIAPRSYTR